jgi:hypothetical protein
VREILGFFKFYVKACIFFIGSRLALPGPSGPAIALKDGKPFYISGPNENLDQSNKIIRSLLRHCGEGNFDYLMSVNEENIAE